LPTLLFYGRSLACKPAICLLSIITGFQAGARGFCLSFFCLDAKEPKNQGCEKIG